MPATGGRRPRRRHPEESRARPGPRLRSPHRLYRSQPLRPGGPTWRRPAARPQARSPTPGWVRLSASVLSPRTRLRPSPRPRTWLRLEWARHGREVGRVSPRPRGQHCSYRHCSYHRTRLLHQLKGTTPRPLLPGVGNTPAQSLPRRRRTEEPLWSAPSGASYQGTARRGGRQAGTCSPPRRGGHLQDGRPALRARVRRLRKPDGRLGFAVGGCYLSLFLGRGFHAVGQGLWSEFGAISPGLGGGWEAQ